MYAPHVFTLPAVFGLGPWEIALIVLVILILFGAKKIPDFARGLGQGIREFKNAANNVKQEIEQEARQIEAEKNKSLH
ncbi:MAG: twin-arginine translocase TatA/TatE family subunit [Bacteroidia bacterium]|nr:twin-arginine translocase TatA/TatE family subunit [Bacteroidia bacterium]MDW8333476.1 twin-arginine translocase TatA/TatE family subunit [Bacteroidia bacterium]